MMIEKEREKIQLLRSEFVSGQKMLADMDVKRANLRETLLRISGAIQVLEEIIAEQGNQAAAIILDNEPSAPRPAAPFPLPTIDAVDDAS